MDLRETLTIYKKGAVLTGIVILAACSSVPLTGRKQTAWIPESELIAMADVQYQEVLQTGPLSNNTTQVHRVKKVGKNIQAAVEKFMKDQGHSELLDGYSWEYNLIRNDTLVNAWCMPGGKVAFYTGILPVCKDEAGIAVVMGHEIAHAVARHGNERMTHGLLQVAGGVVLSEAIKEKPEETKALFLSAYGAATTVGAILPFSRTHESEADEMGLIFMAMAGYDPRTAPEFWERMSANSQGAPPEFLSTHPSHETRIKNLNKSMPKAMEYYQGN
jgi:predicted Zn-dependent protease